MKKLLTLAAALAMTSAANAATTWMLSAEQPDANYLTQNVRQFAADVKEATKGELVINVQSNSTLLKRPEVKRGVQQGVVQAGEVLMSSAGNEDAMFEIDSVPFLASSFDDTEKLWKAAKPIIQEKLDKQGIVLLYAAPWPPQGIYTKTPVTSMSDLSGVRFRAYSASTSRMATLMGAVPTTVNTPEVPQAFSTGVIDAMLTSPATGVDTQAWDYTKFYYDTQAFIPLNYVIVNKRAYDRLPEEQQQAVTQAAEQAEARGWDLGREQTDKLTKTLADHGMSVEPVPETLAAELRKIGETMTTEWEKRAGEEGTKVLNAFRGN
ncbi:TRAP transporter substrate-binding protein [Verticiella sediminum]|uniref:TRAP transporter substrate-binding protein n=1 Tax=Verticiella sediminum TaxID=1247510 RepID=A0A556ABU5_9BURK|nr:TRAP transporter substrate-binding protein [Verticiella sediminum]TSH90366.1 TRAP transporter substrate-binding protein [Verticiella sediminum]